MPGPEGGVPPGVAWKRITEISLIGVELPILEIGRRCWRPSTLQYLSLFCNFEDSPKILEDRICETTTSNGTAKDSGYQKDESSGKDEGAGIG